MKVILNVSENWYRRYLVEIPDNTDPSKFDDEAIGAYLEWLKAGAPPDSSVSQFGSPEYIDDGPSSLFFVEGKYDE